jgi:nucleotide-binding universal stress UspA family protein
VRTTIRKILFTTDLSEGTRLAFEFASHMASRQGVGIVILYVMEEPSSYAGAHLAGFLGEDRWKEIKESQENEARQILIGKKREGGLIKDALNEFCRTAKEELGEENVPADEILVAKGNVVDTILETADAKDCDIIVMGQHTRSTLEETFLGSTTRRLLRRSRIPVLLVPLPEEK